MIEKALFSSGCFWGTQYYFDKLNGVESTSVGYCGGVKDNPTYEEVCEGNTGHLETVEVVYDSSLLPYEDLCKYFFETHDFSQEDGQGPDIGQQYLSAIFYSNEKERIIAEKLVSLLNEMGHKVATKIRPAGKFWIAEAYHQKYYANKGATPYCHIYRKIF